MIDLKTIRCEDGVERELLRIPDDQIICLVPRSLASGEWRECKAVRVVADEDGTVAALEVSNDEEWLTDPEANA